jgi:two-component system OmpR family sensor kinase
VTLRGKIVALVLGLTGALLGGLWLLLSGSWAGWSGETVDRDLLDRAAAAAALVEVEHGDRLELEDDHDADALRDPAHPLRIVGPRGVAHVSGVPLPWPAADRADAPLFETVTGTDGRAWRIATASFSAGGGKHRREPVAFVVQVAGQTAPYRGLEARFRRGLLLALAAALVVGGAGAAALAHLSLAPLRRLAAEADAIGEASLERRVGTAGLDAELSRVATAMNGLVDRLEEAMQRQRQLVSRASHALRTPVATILTRAEVALRRERDPAAYREALGDVVSAARECATLVGHLLTLSRLDERRGALSREEVPLAAVAAEAVQLLAPRAAEAGVALEVNVPEGLAAHADRAALRELLAALLDNAVHYTPAGGRAGLTAAAQGGGCALTVWDTGPGIPPAERERVFDRFFRGAAAQAAGKVGSGLGLAIAKAITDAHGGAITLSDRDGGGLEVRVLLPGAR